ncbi:MAG: type II secretion system secretin GspD [Pseudomonadota bacterium]
MRLAAAAVALPLALGACNEGVRDFTTDPALVVDSALAENRTLPDSLDDAAPPPRGEIGRAAARQRAVQGFIRRGIDGTDLGAAAIGRDPTRLPAGDFSLDFVGADLESVVDVMMSEGLGANYILDPRVEGMVTLSTSRPLRRDEILPVLEEILRLNGAALIQNPSGYTILPRAEAGLSAPLLTFRDVAARGLTVRVTPLRFVTTDDIRAVLESFAPIAGAISYDPARNLVFTIGTTAEQATLVDVISTLDRDTLAGRSLALRPLRSGAAPAVVGELGIVFARPNGSPNPAIRFIAIERMNAVMVVAEQRALFDQAIDLIRVLDQDAGETPRLHVFAVANRRSSELAALLGEIFAVDVGAIAGSDVTREQPLAPGFTPRRDGGLGENLPTGVGGSGGALSGSTLNRETSILVELGHVPGENDPGAVGGIVEGSGGGLGTGPALSAGTAAPPARPRAARAAGGTAGVFRVTADETSNTIVALATREGADAVAQALERLDVAPLQVMIEATLVEVQLNDALEFGVRWFLQDGNFNFNFGDALGTGAASILPGFNAAFRTNDIQVTLSALDEVTDVRLLSSPTLMVLDNQVARLQVGDQVPVTVRSSQSVTDPEAPIVEATEFRDTGVILEIRPTVNASGSVMLQVRQEVSDVSATSAGDENPTFAQRVVESTILVESGETIALAGLIEEDSEVLQEGLPGLSRAPIIGPLFGVSSDSVRRSELLVMIRPIVIRDQSEARRATEELRQKLIGLVPRQPSSLRQPFGG